jgi:WD40 repeat protein
MITQSSETVCKRLVAGILCIAACVSTGCSFYRHHRMADNIVAIGWDLDGSPVSLGQEVTYKSGFVGVSPHIVDPSYDLGPLVVSRPDGRRAVVAGFDSWWQIVWAVPRGPGKGFAVALRKGGLKDRKSVCLLVDNAARTRPCPAAVNPNSENAYVVADSDQLVSWRAARPADARAVNLQTGEAVPASSVPAHLAREGRQGLDLSFSALAPGGTTWAVSVTGGPRKAIWLIEAGAEPRLLAPLSPGDRTPGILDRSIEANVRLFPQIYGLAWAPDGKWIYWCGTGLQALIASTADGSSRTVTPCLNGATWSPDGRRIAGIDEKGVVRVWLVQ